MIFLGETKKFFFKYWFIDNVMMQCTQNWIYNAQAKINTKTKTKRNDTKHGEKSKSYNVNKYAAELLICFHLECVKLSGF